MVIKCYLILQICYILQNLTLCPNETDFENNQDDYFEDDVYESDNAKEENVEKIALVS